MLRRDEKGTLPPDPQSDDQPRPSLARFRADSACLAWRNCRERGYDLNWQGYVWHECFERVNTLIGAHRHTLEVRRAMAQLRSRRPADIWYTLLFVGLGAAGAGLVAASGIVKIFYAGYTVQDWSALSPHHLPFVVASCLASALLGPALWWWAIIKPDHLSVRRGVGVAVLGGLLVHPLVLYLLFVAAYLTRQSAPLSLGNPTNPLLDLISAVLGAVMTVLLAGWITVPMGALAGGVIALLQIKSGCQDRWRAALAG
jgi:hypothetical protein